MVEWNLGKSHLQKTKRKIVFDWSFQAFILEVQALVFPIICIFQEIPLH